MKRLSSVVLGGILMAGLVASSRSPFLSFLAFADGECCGGEQCYIPDMTLQPTTVKPVGTDSIRDAKKPGVKQALVQGITTLTGAAPDRNSDRAIQDTLQRVFKGDYDAVTHIESNYNRTIGRHSDQTICPLTIQWKTRTVILLPANADQQMTNHEEGHQLIEEKVKELAKTRFATAAAGIVNQNLTDAQVDAILKPIAVKLMKIANEASAAYDVATNHGANENQLDQATPATTAFDAAAAANP